MKFFLALLRKYRRDSIVLLEHIVMSLLGLDLVEDLDFFIKQKLFSK